MNEEMTFEEYYQHYLSLHQNKWCRRLHVIGQFANSFEKEQLLL